MYKKFGIAHEIALMMNKLKSATALTFLAFLGAGCQNNIINDPELNPIGLTKTELKTAISTEVIALVQTYITTQFLSKADLRTIDQKQRTFVAHQTDLNGDGDKELFVAFTSSYFCGSGGCTVLLLDSKLNLITKFTSMDFPLIASGTVENGWKDLVCYSDGDRELIYKNGTYPSNPSIEKKLNNYKAGIGAELIFSSHLEERTIFSF